MADVQSYFEQDNTDLDRDVAQCAAVLRNLLEKVNEASSISEARAKVSTVQGAGPNTTTKS